MPCPVKPGCKKGACPEPNCSSACRIHCCDCDGIDPAIKASRKRGGQPNAPDNRRKAFKKSISNVKKLSKDTLTKETPERDKRQKDQVSALWEFHNWADSTKRNLPSVKKRESDAELRYNDVQGWSTIVSSMRAAAFSAAEVLYPCNPEEAMQSMAEKELTEGKSYKTLEENLIALYNSAPKNSIVKRSMRALLSKSLTRSRIQELTKSKKISLGGDSRHQGTKDFAKILDGDKLLPPKFSRKLFKTENLRKALLFMLHESNIGVLSWGTKTVGLSRTEKVTLPRMVRRKTDHDIYESYVAQYIEAADRIGRSSFYKIMKAVTSGGERLATAVDYVTGVLIHDQVNRLQDLVDHYARNRDVKEDLTLSLELVRSFYKHSVDKHIVREDSCSFHGVAYGLSKYGASFPLRTGIKCLGCLYPFVFRRKLLREINRTVTNTSFSEDKDLAADAKIVLNDAIEKFELYRGHRVRVANQQRVHGEIHEEMIQWCLDNRKDCPKAVLVADWKMKFVPLSARETTQQHFAKRGIGWHGFLLYFYKYEQVLQEDGSTKPQAVRYMVYFDQILDASSKQDCFAVASMIELAVMQIKEEVPLIKQLILQSDNAGCYSTCQLTILVGILNARLCIPVIRFMHTETQDGKSLLDAHFARAMALIDRFLRTSRRNRIKRIVTAKGLAAALAWDGGVQNSVVHLVKVDRVQLDHIKAAIEACFKSSTKYFSRANDVIYCDRIGAWDQSNDLFEPEKWKDLEIEFRLKAFAYSGIDEGVTFKINVSKGTFEPEAGQNLEVSSADVHDVEDDAYDPATDQAEGIHDADFQFSTESGSTNENDEGNPEEDVQNEESTDTAQNDLTDPLISGSENEDIARSNAYGVFESSKTFVTRGTLSKRSRLFNIVGPRNLTRRKRVTVEGPSAKKRKDIVAAGVRMASHLIQSFEVKIRDGSQPMPEFQESEELDESHYEEKMPMWARRPPHGKRYGASYIALYKDDIVELFDRGEDDISLKMNPSQMLDALRRKYPKRFTLPGENEIKTFISSLVQKRKTQHKRKSRKRTQGDWIELLEKFIDTAFENTEGENVAIRLQHTSMKPSILYHSALDCIKEANNGSLPKETPDKAVIMRRISAYKASIKKNASVTTPVSRFVL